MRREDWNEVQAIYHEGIATGDATFEEDTPDWDTWNEAHLQSCRLVVREGDRVVAWGALSPVSSRDCYRGVAEATIYVAARLRRLGVGRLLGQALIECADRAGVWTLQAMVFPENEGSLKLLERGGFRRVGVRERLGNHKGRWRDVVLLERRSSEVGSD
jgi:L-amino acid N-acyltransferase YncA